LSVCICLNCLSRMALCFLLSTILRHIVDDYFSLGICYSFG
jgi:hypothetical protein